MKRLILFPYNGNAREALSVIDAINAVAPTWEVLGFMDDHPPSAGVACGGVGVLGGREVLDRYPDAYVLAVPGRPENFLRRGQLIHSLGLPDARFACIVHPAATIGVNVTIGHNTLLMAGVVLTANVSIGNHVVILPNTVVCHESRIGDEALVGSNVSVSGGVDVGRNCYIGSGAKIIQGVTVGTGALVGLGSVVIRDVEPSAVVAGCPAKPVRRSG